MRVATIIVVIGLDGLFIEIRIVLYRLMHVQNAGGLLLR